jgi:DNA polymerase I-like protein with 3'-5' exonuclease and polymerase domains
MRPQTLPELVRTAIRQGAGFYLRGAQVGVMHPERMDPALKATLQAQRDALWKFLGGEDLDRPSLDLMASRFPDIQIVVPRDENEALAVLAQLEADAHAVPDQVQGHVRPGRGLLGFDIETQANPGEDVHQSVTVSKDGKVDRKPALDPPAIRRQRRPESSAALEPRRSSVRLAQLYGGGTTCLVLDTKLVPLMALAPLVSRRTLVVHNAQFELSFLHHAGISIDDNGFECTMQAAGLMLGVHRRGLDDAALQYLGIEVPKDLQTSDWSTPVLSPGQIVYAALDAILALRLWFILRREIIKNERGEAYAIQCAAIAPTVRMEARGFLLDKAAHQAERDKWAIARSDARRAYISLADNEPPQTPDQIRRLLHEKVPADVLAAWPRTEKAGQLSTSKNDLKRISPDIPEIALIVTIKKYEKLLQTFGAEMASRVGTDGRLRASFNVSGAKTGRMSCSDPNLQQMPRDRGMRDCFVAADGCVLIVADYSMVELRAFAEKANDAVLRSDLAQGLDLHQQTAALMNSVPYGQATTEQRNSAKPINFGVIYGAGGKGLAASAWANYDERLTAEDATAARNRFLGRYSAGARWMRTHTDLCQRRAYIEIGSGRVIEAEWEPAPESQGRQHGNNYRRPRRRDLDGNTSDALDDADDIDADPDVGAGTDGLSFDPGDDASWPTMGHNSGWQPYRPPPRLKHTLCCNAPIQGGCADATMLAIALTDHLFVIHNIDGGLVLAVHDELVAEVREDQAEQAAKLIEQAMTAAFLKVFPNAPTNGLVKVKIVKKWGEAKG